MTIKPGHLYQVSISDRGSGTVKAIRHNMGSGLVDAIIIHGKFRNRTVFTRNRTDGDFICFYADSDGVTVKPLEERDDDRRQTA